MAGAEDLMLPVQRVEMDSDDLDVSATMSREQASVARGAALLFPLDAPFTVTGRSAAATVLRIPREAAAEMAEERAGIPAAELRFESLCAISAAVRGLFARTTAFICGELVTSGVIEVSPLVVQEMTRLAASTLLAGFAAAYRMAYGRPPRHTLRR